MPGDGERVAFEVLGQRRARPEPVAGDQLGRRGRDGRRQHQQEEGRHRASHSEAAYRGDRGRDSEGSWTEGSRKARVRLRLEAGDYTVYARLAESQVDWRGGRPATQVGVDVHQGMFAGLWMWLGVFGFIAIGGFLLAQGLLHHIRRMSGSDWSDD